MKQDTEERRRQIAAMAAEYSTRKEQSFIGAERVGAASECAMTVRVERTRELGEPLHHIVIDGPHGRVTLGVDASDETVYMNLVGPPDRPGHEGLPRTVRAPSSAAVAIDWLWEALIHIQAGDK